MKKMSSVVILIREKDKKVLLLLRDSRSTTFPNFWAFIGGGINKLGSNVSEHPTTAAKREALEETGIKVNKLFFLETEKKNKEIIYFFYCTDFEGTLQKDAILTEHKAAAWVDVKTFSKAKTIPGSSRLFLKSLKLIKERGLAKK